MKTGASTEHAEFRNRNVFYLESITFEMVFHIKSKTIFDLWGVSIVPSERVPNTRSTYRKSYFANSLMKKSSPT